MIVTLEERRAILRKANLDPALADQAVAVQQKALQATVEARRKAIVARMK